jgi:hypothetical protein
MPRLNFIVPYAAPCGVAVAPLSEWKPPSTASLPTAGYGGGKYGPKDSITREQLATILNNYAKFAGLTLPLTRGYTPFIDDADIANYAKEAIERFFKAGIIGGYPDGSFKPRGEATRAEFAAMLMRFLEAAELDS